MERYNITVKDNPFDGCPYADTVVSDDGAYVRYDDAQRALDAEREKAKMELLKVENTTLRQLVEEADELYTHYGLLANPGYTGPVNIGEWIGKVRATLAAPSPTEERHE